MRNKHNGLKKPLRRAFDTITHKRFEGTNKDFPNMIIVSANLDIPHYQYEIFYKRHSVYLGYTKTLRKAKETAKELYAYNKFWEGI